MQSSNDRHAPSSFWGSPQVNTDSFLEFDHRRPRPSTAPNTPRPQNPPSHPRALIPGGAPPSLNHDYLFSGPTTRPNTAWDANRARAPSNPGPHPQLHRHYTAGAVAPPPVPPLPPSIYPGMSFHRSQTTPPMLPPKPPASDQPPLPPKPPTTADFSIPVLPPQLPPLPPLPPQIFPGSPPPLPLKIPLGALSTDGSLGGIIMSGLSQPESPLQAEAEENQTEEKAVNSQEAGDLALALKQSLLHTDGQQASQSSTSFPSTSPKADSQPAFPDFMSIRRRDDWRTTSLSGLNQGPNPRNIHQGKRGEKQVSEWIDWEGPIEEESATPERPQKPSNSELASSSINHLADEFRALSTQLESDEALARQLAAEDEAEERSARKEREASSTFVDEVDRAQLEKPTPHPYARQQGSGSSGVSLVDNGVVDRNASSSSQQHYERGNSGYPGSASTSAAIPGLPVYADVVPSRTNETFAQPQSSSSNSLPTVTPSSETTASTSANAHNPNLDLPPSWTPNSAFAFVSDSKHQNAAQGPTTSRTDGSVARPATASQSSQAQSDGASTETPAEEPKPVIPPPDQNVETTSVKPTTSAAVAAPAINVTHYVDPEMLIGVSIGFGAPAITPRPAPMQTPMPNIVTLPYGKSPPLHLQATSWRHLMRLTARLSSTRLEPVLEAMAVAKVELKLRTVIQFIKPHQASSDWRTVLWFTLDYPVPNGPLNARYTNGDVNVLPWSYTLSTLPAPLRDGADSPVSKTYTIPATAAVPYPGLPITFPTLATYLQAALDDSRRYINDSSSGMRKLARMIESCYPSATPLPEDDEQYPKASERATGGVGGLFKRVIGRGNKSNRRGGGGNEDTYELVTPFVPDEWG